MKKKILLTGSSGFLGSHILPYLLKKKIKVFDVLKKKKSKRKIK